MKILLLISIIALPVFPLFAQTNNAAYDQLMTLAGTFINSGNLDAAKQTAQQALQLDSGQWQGNALMAAILEKQNDFTNAQSYIQKAIATAPEDKKNKLNEMAKTIADSMVQGVPAAATADNMTPEARIKYNALLLIAQDADKATLEEERKQTLCEFMAKSAAFLELAPDKADVWAMRALTAVELDYPIDGWVAGRKLKALGLENSDDPKIQKAFAELDRKDWLGEEIKMRDWSKWTTDQAKAAAEAGDEEAQYAMGNWYQNGQSGLSKDETKAAKWYLKAAEQGNAFAQNNLGAMYKDGEGVTQDYAQALDWYHKSAAQGNAGAQNNLGVLYQNGWGVTQDYAQALDWYHKSAAQGNAGAQNNLGAMYKDGEGVTQDYAQALDWYHKSAAQGNAGAQLGLGWMYQHGLGVEKDNTQAKEWYQKAADQGFQPAKDALAKLNQNSQ